MIFKDTKFILAGAAAFGTLQLSGLTLGLMQGEEAMRNLAASGQGFSLSSYHAELAAVQNSYPDYLKPVMLGGIAPYSLAIIAAPSLTPAQ